MPGRTDIERAIRCLEDEPLGDERVSIMIDTGGDEAIMIATSTACVRLALTLLRAAADDLDGGTAQEIDGVDLRCTTSIRSYFDTLAHVVPSCFYLARDEVDRKKVTDFFRKR